jgi:hypothetical protein
MTLGSALLAWWLDHSGEVSVEEIAAYIDRIIITPFVSNAKE